MFFLYFGNRQLFYLGELLFMAIILIYDEAPQDRMLWRQAFESQGHEVRTFLDCVDLEASPIQTRPDVLFMSLRSDFVEEIQQALKTITLAKKQLAFVVVALDRGSSELETKLFSAGVLDVFYRDSVKTEEIVCRISRLLHLRPHADEQAHGDSKKIALINQASAVRFRLQNFFSLKGYKVLTGEPDREALEMVLREQPPVMIIDIQTPKGDGLEYLKELIQIHPEGMCLVTSSLQDAVIARRALKLGAQSYLLKPLNLQYLELAVVDQGSSPLDL